MTHSSTQYIKYLILCSLVFFTLATGIAQASLLITPTRIVFDDRDRAAHVHLVNNSNETKTYRIEIINNLQQPQGGFTQVTDNALQHSKLISAATMLRHSPRQVTLAGGESQQIRIALRRPANMTDGEYRAHLSFTELPPPQRVEMSDTPQLQLHILVSFTIPVVVRQGQVKVNVNLSDLELIQAENEQPKLQLAINRTGDYGVFGNINVEWRPDSHTAYRQIGVLNNLSVYRELEQRHSIQVPLNTTHLKAGDYRVRYTGDKYFNEQVFDQVEFSWQP